MKPKCNSWNELPGKWPSIFSLLSWNLAQNFWLKNYVEQNVAEKKWLLVFLAPVRASQTKEKFDKITISASDLVKEGK